MTDDYEYIQDSCLSTLSSFYPAPFGARALLDLAVTLEAAECSMIEGFVNEEECRSLSCVHISY